MIEIDNQTQTVVLEHGQKIHLSPTELAVLLALYKAAKSQTARQVWTGVRPAEVESWSDRSITQSLRVHIYRLRVKLGRSVIQTKSTHCVPGHTDVADHLSYGLSREFREAVIWNG